MVEKNAGVVPIYYFDYTHCRYSARFFSNSLCCAIHLGFDKEKTLILDFSGDGKITNHYESVKSELKNIPDVTAVFQPLIPYRANPPPNLGSDV